jgi:sigma-E factor negative regulatory protein RseB
MRTAFLVACCLFSATEVLSADTNSPSSGIEWLSKISNAAQQLNYQGIFIYQHGTHVETSRIIHIVDSQGEHEKLEALDGPPREIIRNNDEVMYFLPHQKILKIEKRKPKRSFPALIIPSQFSSLTENYSVKKSDPLRIIGYDCGAVILEPKDNLRYGHKLWTDANTGLLLKAKMINEKNEVIEQFSFIQLSIGGNIDKDAIKPTYSATAPEWRIDRSGEMDTQSQETGWIVKNQPAGFKKVSEMKRSFSGKSSAISHLVFSDGLAAISVFIEPMREAEVSKTVQSLAQRGALNIYTKSLNDYLITVIGEAPPATVMQIGDSVTSSGK